MMNPVYDFHGQVALVTGASSGMGLATAKAFAEAGAPVALADINEEAVQQASETLNAADHQTIALPCDVADEAQVATMVERLIGEFGRLDMAFNNAGIEIATTVQLCSPGTSFVLGVALPVDGGYTAH
jgi:NAD(P)-dependent dehydrogenase (short-subunit alcohol dehydrogenase family)